MKNEEQIAVSKTTKFLFPSEVMVGTSPTIISTVLGSCVAICLYDQRLRIGGMNHYMLPLWNGNGLASPKYGNIAIELLVAKMEAAHSRRSDWVAKVFGGASQFTNSSIRVGDRNIQVAESMLAQLGMKMNAHSLGGTQGRKIHFDTYTGQVSMKYIEKNLIL